MPDEQEDPITIRVLVVDDHPVVRTGIVGMLADQADFEVVAEADDGMRAVKAVRDHHPDVVLMDLRMPRLDGVSALEIITRDESPPKVIVLTTYDADADILRAIEAGATGYLLKDTPREQLFEAIRAAANGESWLAPTIATRLMKQIRTPQPSPLSAREIDVLRLASHGSSNKEIAAALSISQATVKSHLIHIYRKFDVDDRTAAVTYALEKGIIELGS